MAYWVAKVDYESVEQKRNGDPVIIKSEFLVPAESVTDVEVKVAEHMEGSTGHYEVVRVSKSKIEAVLE